MDRKAVTPEDALTRAQESDSDARLEQLDMGDGHAFFFDDRLGSLRQ